MKINHPLSVDTWDKKEYSAIINVLKSKFITQGKNVKKFEKNYSDFLGTKYSTTHPKNTLICALWLRRFNPIRFYCLILKTLSY